MIRQVLLTTPGERADLPEFGCGLRQLLFAPNSDALQATTQLIVQRSLNRWLGDQIKVQTSRVAPGPGGDYSQIVVQIAYMLLETQSHAADPGPGELTWPAATAAPSVLASTDGQRHRLRRGRQRRRRRCCGCIS